VDDYGADPANVVAVGFGANIEEPAAPAPVTDAPRLLFVGQAFERKGGPLLLDAFARVHEKRPDAELWVIGPVEPYREQAGVRWLGRLSRADPQGEATMRDAYSRATAFVMPSLYDPFAFAYLEAMANRLPCIALDRGSVPEVIEEGVNGYRSPQDPGELADRMLALLEDPARAREMGEAGFRRYRERFTWPVVAGRIADEIAARL
jgi:glycosyltransferase involved in cell wall biosynthesis